MQHKSKQVNYNEAENITIQVKIYNKLFLTATEIISFAALPIFFSPNGTNYWKANFPVPIQTANFKIK